MTVVAICLVFLLFPVRLNYKDGGTIEYKAILYDVIFWHALDPRYESGYYEATEIKFFLIGTVYLSNEWK
jgi:hypothetical protein